MAHTDPAHACSRNPSAVDLEISGHRHTRTRVPVKSVELVPNQTGADNSDPLSFALLDGDTGAVTDSAHGWCLTCWTLQFESIAEHM